jgi:hypothetical protein
MKTHQTINEILSNWGKNNQKIPANNSVLKNKILEKVPYATDRIVTKTPLPWLSFAFTTMAILVFIAGGLNYPTKMGISTPPMDSTTMKSTVGESGGNVIANQYYKDIYQPGSPISDRREFLKTYYNASLRTRKVVDLKTRIETIVRGFGGRIDGSSSSEKYGYVSFAIPEEKLEMFRDEIKSLVGAKLYTEQINSDNFLPQKQWIEGEQTQIEKTITNLNSEHTQLVKDHNQIIYSYQSRINTIDTDITRLEVEFQTATTQRKIEITSKITDLQLEKNTIGNQILIENRDYKNRLSNLNSQIKNSETQLESIKKQDKNLIESVSTVNGSISLNWISLWEIGDIYTPGPLLAWIMLALAIASYFWYRRSFEIVI